MKRISVFVFLLIAAYFSLDGLNRFGTSSAQVEVKNNNEAQQKSKTHLSSAQEEQKQKDFELAATIKKFANRSDEGLIEEKLPNGGYLQDLKGRYQNVIVTKLDEDGDMAVGCVSSIEEANAFFGRNLETGEVYTFAKKVPKYRDAARQAERHGMTLDEYLFYTNLIEKVRERQETPESATITIVNADGAGEGFNDTSAAFVVGEGGNSGTTKGQQRLNLFNAAAAVWQSFLDTNVPIRVNSQFNPLTCSSSSATLGSAGATASTRDFGAGMSSTWYQIALANKLVGSDLGGAIDDINAQFNLSIDSACFSGASRFYYGLDNATPANRINLFVVLLHEMGHGLGFATRINGTTGALSSGFADIYSRFTFDEDVNLYWNQMTDAQRLTSVTNEDDVLWDGANVKIASGSLTVGRNPANGRVELYTPASFIQGSSMSHFNTDCSPSLLMEPNITAGLPLDLDLTRQQMRDIGWYRDTNSDLVADTITGVLPSGGNLQIGSSVNITWTNTGGFNRNVTIELSTDGGVTFPTTIASNVANTGSFSFTVPNTPTATGRVRVREYNFVAPLGASGANFNISSAPTAALGSVSGQVLNTWGIGIPNAVVKIHIEGEPAPRLSRTNMFGYYVFDSVPVGSHVMTISAKRYTFNPPSVLLDVNGDMENVNFVAMQ